MTLDMDMTLNLHPRGFQLREQAGVERGGERVRGIRRVTSVAREGDVGDNVLVRHDLRHLGRVGQP